MREPFGRFAIGLRARRLIALSMAVAMGIGMQAGCRHRRNAMRPVFVGPATSAPCPSGDCGGTSVIRGESGYSSGTVTTEPAPEPFGTDDSPEILPPSSPPAASGLPPEAGEPALDRAVTPGATSRESQRPRIDTNSKGGIVTPKAPATGELPPEADEPVLTPPASRTSARPRRGLLGPGRAGLFRRNLQTYVNDPQDLFTPPRAERPWRYVVLHHSAHESGSLDQIDKDHRERLGTMGCGYHFVVGNGSETADGRIEVARRWSEQKGGQHCRDSKVSDINEYGIGICLVGNFEDGKPSAEQLEATRNLVGYLMDRYGIPEGNVVTHDVVAAGNATCPGKNFPVQALLDRDPGLAWQQR